MAKQVGSRKITGTIDDICFYIREKEYLARAKSSLTRKRYLSDPAFEGSRRSNREMEISSPLASRLYAFMDPEKKGRPVFQNLVGKIKLMVKEGWGVEAIVEWFKREYLGETITKKVIKKKIKKTSIRQFARFYNYTATTETRKSKTAGRGMRKKAPSGLINCRKR